MPGAPFGVRAQGRDRLRHFARIGRSVGGVRAEAPLRERGQFRLRAAGREPGEGVVELALGREHAGGLGRVRDERRLAREDHAQDRAEAEDIGPLGDEVDRPERLFGRHERRGPEQAPGLGDVTAIAAETEFSIEGFVAPIGVCGGSFAQLLGQAPVHHLHFAVAPDHHIGRFQVAVDHLVRVGVGDRLADLLERRHETTALRGEVGAVPQQFVEGPAPDQLHCQEGAAVEQRAEVVDGRDGRVLELAGDAGFVGEASGRDRIRAVLRQQHLDRHLAAEGGIGGAVDDAHPAAGDFIAEDIAIGGGGSLRGDLAPGRIGDGLGRGVPG